LIDNASGKDDFVTISPRCL